jgi:hypothetical protein
MVESEGVAAGKEMFPGEAESGRGKSVPGTAAVCGVATEEGMELPATFVTTA